MSYNSENGEPKGDYVKLEEGSDFREASTSAGCSEGGRGRYWSLWWWLKLVFVVTFLGVLVAVFIKWVGPFLVENEILPIIHWEMETFSTKVLALIVFGSVALFPILLLPSTPSMWIAAMTFGYGYSFLPIIGAVAIGFSLPYFIGCFFRQKIHMWLERYPKQASIIRLAGEGNWFNQFRAVALIRVSPFPYVIYNYCAVATNVKYGPYFFGSLVGMVPEIFVALYTGILIKTLADASSDQHSLSASRIIFNVVGFCVTVASTVTITVYAKRRLNELQRVEAPLLQ